jgi:glycosyltransferase involved in cell wall biosynthesis
MRPGVKVTLVARQTLESGREASGWSIPDYGNTRLIDTTGANYRTLVPQVISGSDPETLHLASDAMSDPISRHAWQQCSQKDAPFGFISICPGMYVGRVGQFLRRILYRGYVRYAARKARAILTISEQCRQFFITNGFSPESIFPWAYFVEDTTIPLERDRPSEPRLIYLGRLLKRKRVDVLLRALSRIVRKAQRVRLTIVGSGPEEDSVRQLVRDLQLAEYITMKPTIPHDRVHGELQQYDALVLPTECDDWGVVVNEALQAGLAVITTEQAGACELVQCGRTGLVCKCDVNEFAGAITQLIDAPQKLVAMRRRAREYARTISPSAAAQYLHGIGEHVLHHAPRPCAPWQNGLYGEVA